MERFNPFKLADCLIERDYKIPVFKESFVEMTSNETFMTSQQNQTINLGEYLEFLRSCIYKLQKDVELYSEYHKIAHKIKDTEPRSEYQKGCRDTFGAGFYLERDEYKDFRNQYWKIQRIKEANNEQ